MASCETYSIFCPTAWLLPLMVHFCPITFFFQVAAQLPAYHSHSEEPWWAGLWKLQAASCSSVIGGGIGGGHFTQHAPQCTGILRLHAPPTRSETCPAPLRPAPLPAARVLHLGATQKETHPSLYLYRDKNGEKWGGGEKCGQSQVTQRGQE